MNGPFGVIRAASTGATMASAWMDMLGHNLANVQTLTRTGDEPFRAKYLVVQEQSNARGVQLRQVISASGDAPLIFDDGHTGCGGLAASETRGVFA